MGCLKGSVTKIGSILAGIATIATPFLSAKASVINEQLIAEAIKATTDISATAYCANPKVTVSVGLICSINNEQIIRFEKDTLSWSKEENQVGITKYNLLTASGDWILEEIEELL